MGVKDKLADEVESSQEGVVLTSGRLIMQDRADGDANTAMTASVTRYYFMGILPKSAKLIEATVRAAAAGVGATTTIDIMKVASGTAMTSGTAIITQIAANALTADTNYKAAVKSDGSENCGDGNAIIMKIVTQASETLKPPSIRAIFKL